MEIKKSWESKYDKVNFKTKAIVRNKEGHCTYSSCRFYQKKPLLELINEFSKVTGYK